MMNYRMLGRSDLRVSEIGFGCMSLVSEHSDITKLIHRAIDNGVNFFDTADRYDHGRNEELLGTALTGKRNDVIIATKVGHVWNQRLNDWEWKPSKEHILTAVDDSLKRLNTDRIDLYQLHGGTLEDPIDDIIESFEILKGQGKIRYYGISSIRPNVIREYISRSGIDSVMMQYSLLDRRPEEKCLDQLLKSNISVITRGTLAKGLLIDKTPAATLGYSKEEIKLLQNKLKETGSAAGASLHYVLRHPAVATALAGIRTEKQLDDILSGYTSKFPDKLFGLLTNLLEPNRYQNHR
jgi:aryl-alcohol dehydrogenase-like predicted oxidoreductase